jgi:hypothetical protein
MILLPATQTYAADYTITIQDNSGSKNQEFVFQYSDVAPGFTADAPIHIINDANSSATVELVDIQPVDSPVAPKPAPANNLLPFVNLSLLRDGVVIASGANGAYAKLIDSQICVPAHQTEDLTARFELPTTVGNDAQNTSLWVRYYFRYTVGDCKIATPPDAGPTVNPPNTGDTMLPFLVMGGVSILGLTTLIICGTTFLFPLIFKRRRRD